MRRASWLRDQHVAMRIAAALLVLSIAVAATAAQGSTAKPHQVHPSRDSLAWQTPQTDQSETRAALRRPLAARQYDGVPLGRVIADLSAEVQQPIDVRWHMLRTIGVDEQTRVTMRRHNGMRLMKTLHLLTESLDGAADEPVVFVDEPAERLTVSTRADSPAGWTRSRTFDVRDFIPADLGPAEEGLKAEAELAEEIVMLIRETVDADSWIANGGDRGSIRYHRGVLTVVQTAENLRQVRVLIDQLRETTNRNPPPPPPVHQGIEQGRFTLPNSKIGGN